MGRARPPGSLNGNGRSGKFPRKQVTVGTAPVVPINKSIANRVVQW